MLDRPQDTHALAFSRDRDFGRMPVPWQRCQAACVKVLRLRFPLLNLSGSWESSKSFLRGRRRGRARNQEGHHFVPYDNRASATTAGTCSNLLTRRQRGVPANEATGSRGAAEVQPSSVVCVKGNLRNLGARSTQRTGKTVPPGGRGGARRTSPSVARSASAVTIFRLTSAKSGV